MNNFMRRLGTALIAGTIMLSAGTTVMADNHEHVFVDGICECGKYEAAFVTRIPLKDKLMKSIDEKGTLETITYTYGDTEKNLQVYLPYGYDPAQQYNVVYLMHGGGESEYYWLADEPVYEGTKAMGKTTKAVIDNMINDGKMDPTIFVAPTCITELGENVEDWVPFAIEFRDTIIPLVETKYSTYLGTDSSEENIIATRDHRAFCGFSMGSRCTVNSILMHDLDLVSYYGLFSGPDPELGGSGWEEVKAAIESFGPEMDIKYLYNGNGTSDFELEGHQALAYGLLDSMPDTFQDGKNWCWICFKGGSHAYNCWIVDLYNCMLVFFK